MRKAALLGAAAAIALGVSAAKADVYVNADVYKYVDINIDEWINKYKNVDIDVYVWADPKSVAESDTVINQRNTDPPARYTDPGTDISDTITGSIIGNAGITSVNQASGHNNNQGTAISFAFVDASKQFHGHTLGNSALADSQVSAEQINRGHDQVMIGLKRSATITGSVNNNSGITAVNQATGNINNQANGISIALSQHDGVALSDVALGQLNSGNRHYEVAVDKTASIVGSVNANSGITAVNQTAGSNANQANIVSLSATGF